MVVVVGAVAVVEVAGAIVVVVEGAVVVGSAVAPQAAPASATRHTRARREVVRRRDGRRITPSF